MSIKTTHTSIKVALAAAAAALTLTACGSSTPAQPPGPANYVSHARVLKYGDADFTSTDSATLLALGNVTCEMVAESDSFGAAVADLQSAGDNPTYAQVQALMVLAVNNLCPQYQADLP